MPTAERNNSIGGVGRYAVPHDLRGVDAGHRHSAVQAHAVKAFHRRVRRERRENQGQTHSILDLPFSAALAYSAVKCFETFDFPAASVILENDDPTRPQRVPSRKRAAEKSTDNFGNRLCAHTGFGWLDEPLLA